jgi:hypothetical protein
MRLETESVKRSRAIRAYLGTFGVITPVTQARSGASSDEMNVLRRTYRALRVNGESTSLARLRAATTLSAYVDITRSLDGR